MTRIITHTKDSTDGDFISKGRYTIQATRANIGEYLSPASPIWNKIPNEVRERIEREKKKDEEAETHLGIRLATVEFMGYGKEITKNGKETHTWKYDAWKATLEDKEGKRQFVVDWRSGIGHRVRLNVNDIISGLPRFFSMPPTLMQILGSIRSDSYVLQCRCFEDWATEFGYDEDSKHAEKIYRACLENALHFRNTFSVDLDNYEPLKDY